MACFAMTLQQFAMGGEERSVNTVTKPKWWSRRKYTLWFDPDFSFTECSDWEHRDCSATHLRPLIDSIKESILVEGLHNPLVVTIKDGQQRLHPGKCRAKALYELGARTAPAVVASYAAVVGPLCIPDGCTFIEHMEQAQDYFTDDNVVHMCHRFFSVSKNA